MERARDGDHGAFATIARSAGYHLYEVAFRVLRDQMAAEDAVQQALVSAWRDLGRLREVHRFDAWLYRILLRACYREARRLRRHAALEHDVGTADTTTAVAQRDEMERAFGRLSPDHRAVLVLRHHLGYEPSEIAAVMGVPVGTVRSRLHYAIRVMRAAIEADARPGRMAG